MSEQRTTNERTSDSMNISIATVLTPNNQAPGSLPCLNSPTKEEWMSGLNHLTANEECFGTTGSNPVSSATDLRAVIETAQGAAPPLRHPSQLLPTFLR